MKKFVVCMLTALLLFIAVGCTPASLDEAELQANKAVRSWENDNDEGCTCTSVLDEDAEVYLVKVRYPAEDISGAGTEMKMNAVANDLRRDLYPDLEEIFEDYDVSVGIILSNSNGELTTWVYQDGQVLYEQ